MCGPVEGGKGPVCTTCPVTVPVHSALVGVTSSMWGPGRTQARPNRQLGVERAFPCNLYCVGVTPSQREVYIQQQPDLSSDSDDNGELNQDYGNNVDALGILIPKNNRTTSFYLPSSKFILPFSGPTNPIAEKWRRKFANRRERMASISARRDQADFKFTTPLQQTISSVSASISTFSKGQLGKPDFPLFIIIKSHDECCADTGATDIMLNDYDVFVSYCTCTNCYGTLVEKKSSVPTESE